MFMPMKSLGSSIGLPFLSQTEDKQLLFRVGKDGVKRLSGSEVRTGLALKVRIAGARADAAHATQVIPQDDYAYWAQVR